MEVDKKQYFALRGVLYAFVTVACRTGTGGSNEVVEIYAPSKPVTRIGTLLADMARSPENPQVTAITITGDTIVVTARIHGPNDANCCPSGVVKQTYVFNGVTVTKR